MGEATKRAGSIARRLAAATGTGGLVALTLALLVAPATLGAGVHPGTVYTAPFGKVLLATDVNNQAVACGIAKTLVQPHFSKVSGTGGFSSLGKAPKCANLPANVANRGDTQSQFSIILGIKPAHNHLNITTSWTFSAAGTESLVSGKCTTTAAATSNCYEVSQTYLFAAAYLVDSTNGSIYPAGNFWPGMTNISQNNTYCSSGSCTPAVSGGSGGTFSGSASVTWFVNATSLVTSQAFFLEIDVYGGTVTELDAYNAHVTGGLASASLNFASLGNGAKMTSITVV